MQNSKIIRLVCLVIGVILYSALVFSGLFRFGGAFPVSYIFSIIAFIYVFSMWIMDRDNSCSLAGGKLRLTPLETGIFYLVITMVLSIMAGIFPDFSTAALIVLDLIVLCLMTGLTVMMFQKTEQEKEQETAADTVPASDGKLLQQMRSEVNVIADSRESLEERRRLQRIAERLRIASPVSTEEIDSIDRAMLREIEEYGVSGDVSKLISSMDACLDERRRLEVSLGV